MNTGGPTDQRGRAALPLLMLLFVALTATGATGCLDDRLDPSQVGSTDVFTPLLPDFIPFRSWSRVQVGDALIAGGHAAGPRFCYVNQPASNGSYPIGTIIVKTVETGDPNTWTIHARAKQGGGVNPQGALDWYWYELLIFTSGDMAILWSGTAPPVAHGYEALPGVGATSSTETACNTCHTGPRDSDSILAAPLRMELGL
jgi:hypothetical protein